MQESVLYSESAAEVARLRDLVLDLGEAVTVLTGRVDGLIGPRTLGRGL
jgi:hypothetical protein